MHIIHLKDTQIFHFILTAFQCELGISGPPTAAVLQLPKALPSMVMPNARMPGARRRVFGLQLCWTYS